MQCIYLKNNNNPSAAIWHCRRLTRVFRYSEAESSRSGRSGSEKVCWLCSFHFLLLGTRNITLCVLEMLRFIFCVYLNVMLFSNMNVQDICDTMRQGFHCNKTVKTEYKFSEIFLSHSDLIHNRYIMGFFLVCFNELITKYINCHW